MALDASRRDVLAGEREGRLGRVIEGGSGPIRGGMAELAILREAGGGVVRIGSALIVIQVAGIAGGAQALENAASMALDASRGDVFAGQRECGLGGVIEFSSGPISGGVALGAILREAGGSMIGIRGALVVLQMA